MRMPDLLPDYPSGSDRTYRRGTVEATLERRLTSRLKAAARRLEVTVEVFLQAAFYVLLARAGGDDFTGDDLPPEMIFTDLLIRLNQADKAAGAMNGASILQTTGVEEDVKLTIRYNACLMIPRTMRSLMDYLRRIVQAVVDDPGRRIAGIRLISPVEAAQIMEEFNDTEREYPLPENLHSLLENQAARRPDHTALIWPGIIARSTPAAAYSLHMSYNELKRRADCLARTLRRRGSVPGDIVGLMVKRTAAMIVGIMGILKAGAAYMPVEPGFPPQRQRYLLADSGAAIVLGTEEIESADGGDRHEDSGLPSNRPPASGSPPAYVLYTSGSTGLPKGVLVEHRSVLNIVMALAEAFPLSLLDRWLLKTSYLFDVSITEIFGWIPGGGSLAILEEKGEREPEAILEVIERLNVTHLNFVPSMFRVFLDFLNPGNRTSLSKLKYIFLAGEAVAPEPVNRFKAFRTGIILENLYGPTEGTVYASRYSLADWEGEGRIPIGRPLPNIRLFILDRSGNLLPVGLAGELCISGAGVARGYLNRPELTAEKFVRRGEETWYRTGDLARWRRDGHVDYLGRIDQQVKIRGFRVEPAEIERELCRHPALKDALLTMKEDRQGHRFLTAYYVPAAAGVSAQVSLREVLRNHLAACLPDYMIPAYFVPLERIPLNASGKVDRRGLPEPQIRLEEEGPPPRNEVEDRLAGIWSQVMGREDVHLGIDTNLFRAGGDSIKVIKFISRLNNVLEIKVPIACVFELATLRRLSEFIIRHHRDRWDPIHPLEKKEFYPASRGQARIWALNRRDEAAMSYMIPVLYYLEGELDQACFSRSLERLVERHESLRTVFEAAAGEVRQKIMDPGRITIPLFVADLRQAENSRAELDALFNSERHTPFDLGRGPLLRAGILRTGTEEWILLLTIHHIIGDYISCILLVRDLFALYRSYAHHPIGSPAPLKIQYKDYAAWYRRCLDSAAISVHRDYWLSRLLPPPPPLDLPLDRPRPRVQTFAGETVYFSIPGTLSADLTRLGRQNGATLFMTLLAAVYVFLYRYTGREDMAVGTPFAGREHPALANQIGFFINTLPLRLRLGGKETFLSVQSKTRQVVSEGLAHQAFPFDRIVETLGIPRDISRHPLFDVVVDMMDFSDPPAAGACRRLELSPVFHEEGDQPGEGRAGDPVTGIEAGRCKFDLTIYIFERRRWLDLAFEYNTDLFVRRTILTMCRRFRLLLESVCRNPALPVEALAMEEEIILPDIRSFARN